MHRENLPGRQRAKSNEDGKCYRGQCISQAGSCIDPNTGGAIYDGSTPHTSYCDGASDCSITYAPTAPCLAAASGIMNRPATARSAARARYAARPPSTRTWTSGRAGGRDLVVRRRAGLERLPLVLRRGRLPGAGLRRRGGHRGRPDLHRVLRGRRARRAADVFVAPTVSPPPSVSPVPTGRRPCRPRRRRRRRSRPRP